MMEIRKARREEIIEILNIYSGARAFMRENGNPTQWGTEYPYREIIDEDIRLGRLYVICEESELFGVFAFIEGPDSDYDYIDGAWLNSLPYFAIHRVASAGKRGGMMALCVEYCLGVCENLRIDTHEDNLPMQRSLERLGFKKCGKVYIERAGERIAYQLSK
jgi:RimJ/RimL family protein N-acetyltransferase